MRRAPNHPEPARTLALAATALAILVSGCASPSTQARREEPAARQDAARRWSDDDARRVAKELARDVLARPWLEKAERRKDGAPTVLIEAVNDDTEEGFDTGPFVAELRRWLRGSGRVELVASPPERVGPPADDAGEAPGPDADFALSGAIRAIEDATGAEAVTLYEVTLKLVDARSGQVVWIGQKTARGAKVAAGATASR